MLLSRDGLQVYGNLMKERNTEAARRRRSETTGDMKEKGKGERRGRGGGGKEN